MSWSFSGVGTPAALKTALDENGQRLTGQSREEFDQAAPHLKALLDCAHDGAAVAIEANGHASFENGKRTHANIYVSIKQLGPIYT